MPRPKKPSPLSPLDELFNTPVVAPEIKKLDEATATPQVMGSTIQKILLFTREIAIRRAEALALYEPLPMQQRFHECMAPERLLRGSIRGGKTLPAAVEVARSVTGQDPYGKWPERDGVFYIVAPNEAHLADVIYPKLFKAGAFWMIRDLGTGKWRAYQDRFDHPRKRERKKAPPLIPPRFVADIAWKNKKRGVPDAVRLKNGWRIGFFVEGGEPQRGVDIDGVWFDEEIGGFWYQEMSGRLLDREGRFIWSAAPQTGTQTLYELHKRAEEQMKRPEEKRTIVEFHILLRENPHIDPRQQKMLAEKLTEEEARILIDGEYAILSYRVYPSFDKARHGIQSFDIPGDWTHYAAIDPGHQVCAVALFASPPSNEHKYLYGELYIKQSSSELFAEQFAPCVHGRNFEAFIVDRKNTQVTDVGSGKTIEVQYEDALKKFNIRCNAAGHGFLWGSRDVQGRLSAFRSWLNVNPKTGKPIFLYFIDTIKWFVWEIERYHNKKKNGQLTDQPYDKDDHLMWCVGAAASHGLPFVPKPEGEIAPTGAYALYERWKAEDQRKKGGEYIRLGPGTPK